MPLGGADRSKDEGGLSRLARPGWGEEEVNLAIRRGSLVFGSWFVYARSTRGLAMLTLSVFPAME